MELPRKRAGRGWGRVGWGGRGLGAGVGTRARRDAADAAGRWRGARLVAGVQKLTDAHLSGFGAAAAVPGARAGRARAGTRAAGHCVAKNVYGRSIRCRRRSPQYVAEAMSPQELPLTHMTCSPPVARCVLCRPAPCAPPFPRRKCAVHPHCPAPSPCSRPPLRRNTPGSVLAALAAAVLCTALRAASGVYSR